MCLFPVMVVRVMSPHVLLGATSEQTSQPSVVTGVHVTVRIHCFDLPCSTHSKIFQKEAGNAAVSVAFKFYLPGWMLCLRSGTEDGRH